MELSMQAGDLRDLSGQRVVIVATTDVRLAPDIPPCAEYVPVVSTDAPDPDDVQLRCERPGIAVDCLRLAAASENAFGPCLDRLEPQELRAIQEKIESVTGRLLAHRAARTASADRLKQTYWTEDPRLILPMQDVRRVWNEDWILMVLDPRFVSTRAGDSRMAVSCGVNQTSPQPGTPFLAPPELPGVLAFGLHNVIITPDHGLCLVDCWMDAFPVEPPLALEHIREQARAILEAFSDEIYQRLTGEGEDDLPVQRSLITDPAAFHIIDVLDT